MRRLAAIALVAVAGCNQILGIDGFTTAGDDDDDVPPDAMTASLCGPLAPPGSVVGCATVTHVFADGTTAVTLRDMSVFTVSVLVPDDSAEGYETINGTGSADGVVRIDGVPDGPYWLRLHDPTDPFYAYPHYFYTDERDLDLGIVVRGRDDTPATLATSVTLDITNMSAWKFTDLIELHSINNGTASGLGFSDITDGATALDDVLDWQAAYSEVTYSDLHDFTRRPQLVIADAPHGDDFRITHYRSASLTVSDLRQATVSTILETVEPAGVTMSNGGSITVQGAFTPVTPGATPQNISINPTTARSGLRDGTRYGEERIRCLRSASPAAADGLDGGQLSLLTADVWPAATSLNAQFSYANPYPTQWPHLMWCEMSHLHISVLPGVSPRYGYSYLQSRTPVTDNYNWNIATHAPENITVGGKDALAGGTIAFDGESPVTISWDGVTGVNHYAVRVLSTAPVIAKFDTTETSIAMPADLFTAGEFYVFRVYSIQTSGDFAGGHLFELGMPVWSSRVSTGFFRFSSDCGDGDVDPGESCDPGPSGNTGACDVDCTPAVCGDGFVNSAANEQCDEPTQDGTNNAVTCDSDCQIPACTDGHWNPAAEECDDGNQVDTDACTNACVLTTCGNSTEDPPFEGCDDGNRTNGDGCDAYCRPDQDLR